MRMIDLWNKFEETHFNLVSFRGQLISLVNTFVFVFSMILCLFKNIIWGVLLFCFVFVIFTLNQMRISFDADICLVCILWFLSGACICVVCSQKRGCMLISGTVDAPLLQSMPAGLTHLVLSMAELDIDERAAWKTSPMFQVVCNLFAQFHISVEEKKDLCCSLFALTGGLPRLLAEFAITILPKCNSGASWTRSGRRRAI